MRLFLLKLLGRLPLPVRRWLGARLGDSVYILGIRRAIAYRNLVLAFPQLGPTQLKKILRRHYQLFGGVFFDECAMLTIPKETFLRWIKTEHSIPDDSVIFCVPHFIGAGIGGIWLNAKLKTPIVFYYKPLHNKFWNLFYKTIRGKYGGIGLSTTAKGGLRLCVRAIKQGKALFYLPDTDPGKRKNTIFCPFLGVQNTATATAIPRFMKITSAKVYLFSTLITKTGYQVHLAELSDLPTEDETAYMTALNQMIGDTATKDPAQYYWLHRRFKTRPQGEADIYSSNT